MPFIGLEPILSNYKTDVLPIKLKRHHSMVQQQVPLPLPCYDLTAIKD